tara:strand:+ start:208 stop:327 length:120 start_codon:yes stop_codon:yes gene_type:complete
MIALKTRYEGEVVHSLNQEYLQILKEQKPDFFNKYFEEK